MESQSLIQLTKILTNFASEINSNKYLIAGNGAIVYDIQRQTFYERP